MESAGSAVKNTGSNLILFKVNKEVRAVYFLNIFYCPPTPAIIVENI